MIKKQNIKLHFDMHHGYGILDKAINHLNKKREFYSKNLLIKITVLIHI